MVAGMMPRRVSVKPIFSVSTPTATSQTEAMPTPPPKALPCSLPITGFGSPLSAPSIVASLPASAERVSASISRWSRIQPRSPPAQKDLPAPVSTTTRTASSSASLPAAAVRSASICADMALCFSGRLRVSVATPRASVSIVKVSYMSASHCPCYFGGLQHHRLIDAGVVAKRRQMFVHRLGGDIARCPRRIGAAAQATDRRVEHPQAHRQ